jgi:fibronectin-binding autotransporter adhesin
MSLIRRPAVARSFAVGLLAVMAVSVAISPALAVTRTWDGGGVAGTDMSTAVNWSGDTLPNVNGDVAQWNGTVAGNLSLTWSGSNFAGSAGNTGVSFDITASQTGSLLIDPGANTNALRIDAITIASGAGAFTLGNGANTTNITFKGAGGQTNTWTNNSANTATIGADVVAGFGGGGTHNLTFAGSGNWNFAGKLGTGNGTIGNWTLNGGASSVLTITSAVSTASGNGSIASVFVNKGTIAVDTGGTVRTTNFNSIGQTGTDVGALTLKGSGAFISGNDFNVGDIGSSQGTLTIQDTGSLTVNSTGGFFVGSANAAASTASGIVNHSAGTLTANRTVDGAFVIGGRNAATTGGSGSYNLSGTGVVTNAGNAWIGGYGTGTVTQTGGTWNNASFVSIGRQAGSIGNYNISAGGLNQTGSGTEIIVAEAGTGTLTVSGTGAVTTTTSLRIGSAATASGTVHLNGGSITTPNVKTVGGTSTFNFNGGTLKPSASSTTFMTGLTTANVRNNGAVIDTNTFDITIGQTLIHSTIGGDNATDGGLTKINTGTLTMTGANTYNGPTSVTGGTLAYSTSQSSIGTMSVSSGATLGVKHTTGGLATLTTTNLTLAAGTPNLSFDFNGLSSPTAALMSTGAFTNNGTLGVTFANATNLSSGTYTLISYTSYAGGGTFPGSTYTFTPRTSGTINNNGTNALLLNVTADKPVWTGLDSGQWKVGSTGANSNWKLVTAGTPTDYIEGDAVLFDDSATGTLAIDISAANVSPTSVTFNNLTNTYTVSSGGGFGIAGTGLMVKNGGGSATINTTNSYSGGTTVNNGTLNANAANALGTGAVAVTGGTLNVNHASGLGGGAVTMTGGALDNTSGGAITLSTNNVQSWNGDFSFIGTKDLNMGTGAVTLGGSGSSRTVTVNAGTFTVGTITGATKGLTKAGAGTLAITTSGAGSNIAGTLNVTGGTLQINTGVDSATTSDFTATGLAGSGTIQNGGGVERWVIINNTGSDTFSGSLQNGGAGALGLSKMGIGSLTLAGASTYTGTTTLNAGTLVAANGAALGSTFRLNVPANSTGTFIYATDGGDNTVPIGIGTGTTVLNVVSDRATAGAAVDRTMTVPAGNGLGGGTINFSVGANVTSGTPKITFTQLGLGAGSSPTTTLNPVGVNLSIGNVSKFNNTPTQTLELGGTSTGNEVTGIISNGTATGIGVSITKSGTGTWTLSGANTYTGNTILAAGTLVARSTSPFGGSARLNVTGVSGSGPGAGTFVYATDGGDAAVPIGMGTGSTFTVVSDRATPGAAVDRTMSVLAGNGLGGGTINFTKGSNVTSGTPKITFTQLGLGAGSTQTTTLNPTDVNLSIGNVSKFNNTPAQTLELSGNSTGNEITGVVSNGTATIHISKSGTGTWVLSGANTYTGITTVNGGKLLINGTHTGGGAYTVNSGGTLGGTGSIGSNITVLAGGTLSPGASVESLAVVGNVTLGDDSIYQYEIDTTAPYDADLTDITGGGGLGLLAIGNNVTLSATDLTPGFIIGGMKFTLVRYNTGGWNGGTFAGLPDGKHFLIGPHEFIIDYNDTTPGLNGGTAGGEYVTITTIPEASALVTTGLVLLSALGAVWVGKRMGFAAFQI